jgi:hypothetical protein
MAFTHMNQNKPRYLFHLSRALRIFNVVQRANSVVITQCVVCHFFVKVAESTNRSFGASQKAEHNAREGWRRRVKGSNLPAASLLLRHR